MASQPIASSETPTSQASKFDGILAALFRLIPSTIRGKRRVAKLLLRGCENDANVEVGTRFGKMRVPSLGEPIAFSLLVDGDYEPETWRVIQQQLAPNGTFVDVGANVGLFTIKADKHLVDGRVIAIEASPHIFQYLEQNVDQCERVTCINCAITDSNQQQIDFYEAPDPSFGMGALAPQFDSKPVSVTAKTLDYLLEESGISNVDVVKVDVEGFEASVFQGATNLLSSEKQPVIVFEFLDWAEERAGFELGAAQKVLLEAGYSLSLLGPRIGTERQLSEPLTRGGGMIVARPR